MNKQQVETDKFFRSIEKFIRKMDKQAGMIITTMNQHVSPTRHDSVAVTVRVLHGQDVVYRSPYNKVATLPQLKQLLRKAYKEYTEQKDSAV